MGTNATPATPKGLDMNASARRPNDHLSEEEKLLCFMKDDVLRPRQREAMYQHIISCPTCLAASEEPLMRLYSNPNAQRVLAGPGHVATAPTSGRPSAGLRLAASPQTLEPTAAELAALRLAPFLTVAGIEILRVPNEDDRFIVSRVDLAHKTVEFAADGRVAVTVRIDGFGCLVLSADQQALLKRWVETGVAVEIRVQ